MANDNRTVLCRGRQRLSVRRESYESHRRFVLGKLYHARPIAGPPQEDRPILRCGSDVPPAWREAGVQNRFFVSLELQDLDASTGIPYRYRPVLQCHQDKPPVWEKRERVDLAHNAGRECLSSRLRFDVPEFEPTVPGCGDNARASTLGAESDSDPHVWKCSEAIGRLVAADDLVQPPLRRGPNVAGAVGGRRRGEPASIRRERDIMIVTRAFRVVQQYVQCAERTGVPKSHSPVDGCGREYGAVRGPRTARDGATVRSESLDHTCAFREVPDRHLSAVAAAHEIVTVRRESEGLDILVMREGALTGYPSIERVPKHNCRVTRGAGDPLAVWGSGECRYGIVVASRED